MKINTQEVPYSDVQNISRTFLAAVKRFYEDPENMRQFEDWKRQRAEVTKKPCTG